MAMKFRGWLHFEVRRAYFATICRSCSTMFLPISKMVSGFFTEYLVSYCDHSPSIGVRPSYVRPSVHNLLVSTLASTNINQSSPNLLKMCMTTRARMSSIMELIGPELSELSALELENLPYLTMFIL